MAKYSTTIDYNITTKLDASGITQLQQKLIGIESEFTKLGSKQLVNQSQVTAAVQNIQKVRTALNSAFDFNTGMLNTQKFFGSLEKQGTNLTSVTRSFAAMGTTGQKAITTMVSSVGRLDTQLKSMSTTSNKILTTLGNTVRWGLVASAFQTIMNSAHQAVQYMKDLDKSLTDIQMVGHSSAEDMRELALQANEAAKALGSTTTAYTDATKIFVQQGLSLEDSQQFAEMSLKLSNVAGESAEDAAQQITALKNGFQMAGDTVESSLDKIVKTSHITASSVEELATAATRVAATANTLGVTDEQLYSQLSTIIQVTREAPEIVGNSLKTIYARFADLKLGETLEDGMNLGAFSGALEKLGVNVLDSNGQLREMGSIIEDLMTKWDTFDRATKQGAAVTLAGKFQYNRLMTLMENADAYRDTLDKLQNDSDVEGLLQNKNDEVYLESLEGKANQLKATFEELISNLFNQRDFAPIFEGITKIVDKIDEFVKAVGGGIPVLTLFGSTLTKVFSTQIAQGITNMFTNNLQKKIRETNAQVQATQLSVLQNNIQQEANIKGTQVSANNQKLINYAAQGASLYPQLNEKQVQSYNEQLSLMEEKIYQASEAQEKLRQQVAATNDVAKIASKTITEFGEVTEMVVTAEGKLDEGIMLSQKQFTQLQQVIEKVGPSLQETATIYSSLVETINRSGKSGASSQGLFKQLGQQLVHLRNQEVLTDKETKQLIKSLGGVRTAGTTKELDAALTKLAQEMQQVTKMSERMTQGIYTSQDALFHAATTTNQYAEAADKATMAGQQLIKQFQQQINIQGIVNAVGGIGQLAFAIQSVQHLGSIWNNDDISTGEKLLQTVINLSFALPMLVQGFKMLRDMSFMNNLMKAPLFTTVNEAKSTEATMLAARAEQQKRDAIKYATMAEEQEAIALQRITQGNQKAAQSAQVMSQKYQQKSQNAKKCAIATEEEAIATKNAATTTTGLGKAFSFLGGPIGIAVIAIGAIVGALSFFEEQSKQTLENLKEAASESQEKINNIITSSENFDKLYKQYKNTGSVTDELRQATTSLVDELEISGGKALIAAGNYEELAKQINEAKDASLREAASNERSLIIEFEKQFDTGNFFDASVSSDVLYNIKNALGAGYMSDIYSQISEIADQEITNIEAASQYFEKNPEKFLLVYKNIEKQLEAEIEDLDHINNRTEKENSLLEQKNTVLQNIRTSYKEELDGYEEAKKALAQDEIQQSDTQQKLSQANNLQEFLNIGNENAGIKNYLETLDSDIEKADFLFQYLSEDALNYKQILEELNQLRISSSVEDLDNSILGASQATYEKMIGLGHTEEAANRLAEEVYQILDKAEKYTADDKLQLIATLNQQESIADINTILEMIQNGDDINDIIAKVSFEPSASDEFKIGDFGTAVSDVMGMTDQELETAKQQLKAFNDSWDSETISQYAKTLSQSTDTLKNFTKENEARISSLKEARTELVKEIDERKNTNRSIVAQKRELAYLDLQIQQETNALESLVIQQLLVQKGVQECSDALQEYGNILAGDIQLNNIDYIEALNAMSLALQDLINIDMSSWDPTAQADFIKNNLQDIQLAIDGDYDAWMRLKIAASEKIGVEVGLNDTDFWTAIQDIQNWAASGEFAHLEAGASLNDVEFLNNLTEMLIATGATAQQIEGIVGALSALGIEAHIEYEYVDLLPNETGNLIGPGLETKKQVVKRVTYTKTGPSSSDFNNYAGNSRGPVSSDKTSGGGGGSKGSSGGGKSGGSTPKQAEEKKYEPKHEDPIEEEIDRYERVDTLLKAVDNDLKKVANEQDRLTGKERIANMSEQLRLLEKQRDLQKEKLEIQKQEAAELKNSLASQYGVQFDSEGYITNYAQVHQQLTDDVNNLVAQYNAATTEEEQEALKKKLDAAKERLAKFKEEYKKYDDLVSDGLKSTLQALEDIEDEMEDIRIQALKTANAVSKNVKEMNETLADFNAIFTGLRKDDPIRRAATSAAKLAGYFGDGTKSATQFYDTLISKNNELLKQKNLTDGQRRWYQYQNKKYQEAKEHAKNNDGSAYGGYIAMNQDNMATILDQIDQYEKTGTSSIFGKNGDALYETAKEVFNDAVQLIQDLEDEFEELLDAILGIIDKIGDEIDERAEAFQNITDELEYQYELAEKLAGIRGWGYEDLNVILQGQQNNYDAAITFTRESLAELKKLLGTLEEGSDEWKATQQLIVDTQKDLNDLVEKSLENLQKMYENTLNNMLDNWSKELFGNADADWLEDQWEMITRNADQYLDDVNAAYNIQKLQSKYQDLLDNAGDLATQQKITQQMQEQLGYLREKEKISEYDVQYAEMQIELLQKRIALEEAQRNKSQLKLRRDSQGNYNYAYTADTEATKGAQEDLLDAQNNAYNLSKEAWRKSQEDALSAWQNARQMISNIWSDTTLTYEEKVNRINAINDYLVEYLQGCSEQLGVSETNIINDFLGMCELLTSENGERLSAVEEDILNGCLETFDQIEATWNTSLANGLRRINEFGIESEDMNTKLNNLLADYESKVHSTLSNAKQDYSKVTDAVKETEKATKALSSAQADFINQLKNDIGSVQQYEKQLKLYREEIARTKNAMQAYQEQVNQLQKQLEAKERENAALRTQVAGGDNPSSSNSNSSGSGSTAGSGGKTIRVGETFGFTGKYYYDSWGQSPAGSYYAGQPNAVRILSYSSSKYGGSAKQTGDFDVSIGGARSDQYQLLGWVKASQLFDTGGYTGSWTDGSIDAKNGKLAWLHSKELVLNADDTKNILSVVQLVRDMVQDVKTNALNNISSNNIGKAIPQLGGQDNIEQTVTIEASFPNANSVSEIQDALLGLADRSLQYANKYR